mgnify:CR=1 FL=1
MPTNPYGLYARFSARNANQAVPRPKAAMQVQSYSWNEIGGPKVATIRATGDDAQLAALFDLIGCPVEIRDQAGEARWWGRVVSVSAGAEGVTLDDMANSIAIVYTTTDKDGASVGAKTSWLTDALSIAEYGTKQLLKTTSTLTPAAAAQMQANALTVKRYPPVKTDISARSSTEATIVCRGEWDLLRWVYYGAPAIGAKNWPGTGAYTVTDSQLTNYKAEPENQSFQFGDASTSQYVRAGFKLPGTGTRPVQLKTLRLKGAKINNPVDPLIVDIYGDDGAGGLGTLMGSIDVPNATVPAGSHAWFDVSLNSGTLKLWAVPGVQYHYKVRRTGALDATKYYRLAANSALGYTDGASFAWNGSTWSSTSPNGNPSTASDILFEVVADTTEASFDLNGTAVHQRIAIPFQLGGTQNAAALSLAVTMQRNGNPAGTITGYVCDDSSGSPGTPIDYVSVNCSDVPTEAGKVVFNLTGNVLRSPTAPLWLQLYPSYGTSGSDYVRVLSDPTNAYLAMTGAGPTKAYNGSVWSAIAPAESMWFEVVGGIETTEQIKNVIVGNGQFVSVAEIETPSGVFTSPYRDGNTSGQVAIADQLTLGTAAGEVLLATITKEKRLRILADAGSDPATDYAIDGDGQLFTALSIPADKCRCPVGVWIKRKDSLAAMSGNSALLNTSSYAVAEAEYNAVDDSLRLTPRGARDPFSIGLRDG